MSSQLVIDANKLMHNLEHEIEHIRDHKTLSALKGMFVDMTKIVDGHSLRLYLDGIKE